MQRQFQRSAAIRFDNFNKKGRAYDNPKFQKIVWPDVFGVVSCMPLLFACFAVVAISISTTAVAVDEVPFNGIVTGQIPSDLGPPVPGPDNCVFDFFVNNSGHANRLGNFSGQAEFRPNLCTGSYTGAFHWIAANGDEPGTFA